MLHFLEFHGIFDFTEYAEDVIETKLGMMVTEEARTGTSNLVLFFLNETNLVIN